MLVDELTRQFIIEHREDDVLRLALRQKQYSQEQYPQPTVGIAFALQQIQGWQRARHKLPTISAIDGWLYPASLPLEQCSSETTARHKAEMLSPFIKRETSPFPTCAGASLIDMTGGMGVDTYFLSELFDHTLYIERQAELAEFARHNFALTGKKIEVVNADAKDYLNSIEHVSCIYCDPARRDAKGGKVFRLADCEPDLTALYSLLSAKADLILLKLSPMLDLNDALRTLADAVQIEIVAVRGEVKELLILCVPPCAEASPLIRCLNLETLQEPFSFLLSENKETRGCYATELCRYLYEPNAALMSMGVSPALDARRVAMRKRRSLSLRW